MPWRCLAAATVAIVLFTAPMPAGGQSAPALRITTPSHGQKFDTGSTFYDSADHSIRVFVDVGIKRRRWPASWELVVNGERFSGPNDPPRAFVSPTVARSNVSPSQGSQYHAYYTDAYNPMTPILAEIYDRNLKQVIARDRIIVYDARSHSELETSRTGELKESIGVQLTPHGLERLERVHRSSMPQPSLAEFNALLFDKVAEKSKAIDLGTEFTTGACPVTKKNHDRICFPYTEVDHIFPEGAEFLVQRHADYLAYRATIDGLEASKAAAAGLTPPWSLVAAAVIEVLEEAAEKVCVKELPLPRHLEVCFSELEGELIDLDLLASPAIRDVQLTLEPTDSGRIDADPIALGELRGRADLRLGSPFMRWKWHDSKSLCCGVPEPIEEGQIAGTEDGRPDSAIAMDTAEKLDFAECPDVELYAKGATNVGPFGFMVKTFDSRPEHFAFKRSQDTAFALGTTGPTDVERGACALETIGNDNTRPLVAAAESLVDNLYSEWDDALREAWKDGTPPQEVAAADLLFEPFALGAQEPEFHELDWKFKQVGANATDLDHNGDPALDVDGLFGLLNTSAETRARSSVKPLAPSRFFFQPTPLHWTGAKEPVIFSATGTAPGGTPFDVGYFLTTGALNQVLGTWENTRRLIFQLSVTNSTLLDQISKGRSGESSPIDLFVLMEPTLPPIVFMHHDPPRRRLPDETWGFPPDGEWPLTYMIGQWRMTVLDAPASAQTDPEERPTDITKGGAGQALTSSGWRIALTAAVDAYDNDFNLDFATGPGARTLDPVPGGGPWREPKLDILSSKLPFCPIEFPYGHGPEDTCINQLASLLLDAVKGEVLSRLPTLLEEFPAPLLWNAAGESKTTRRLTKNSVYKMDQRVIFFGDLQ